MGGWGCSVSECHWPLPHPRSWSKQKTGPTALGRRGVCLCTTWWPGAPWTTSYGQPNVKGGDRVCADHSALNPAPSRPLIQHKLEVLSQAGLARADFSADSTVMRDPHQLTLDQLLQFDADLALPEVDP